LCANLRQWLTSDVQRAERYWLDWIEQGCALFDGGKYSEAALYFGCAFELADYLLAGSWPSYPAAARRFTQCAISLMESYQLQGEAGLRNYLLVSASSRLARELQRRQGCQVTADCIEALYQSEPRAPRRCRLAGQGGGVPLHTYH
jgi:hypothetical protein